MVPKVSEGTRFWQSQEGASDPRLRTGVLARGSNVFAPALEVRTGRSPLPRLRFGELRPPVGPAAEQAEDRQ
jgi:hypothetical protein